MNTTPTVAVVGLGYVGLPLAVAFGRKFRTIGYDLSEKKIADYRRHIDPTGEVSSDELRAAAGLDCTTDPRRLAETDFVVCTSGVPAMIPLFRLCQHDSRQPSRQD